MRIIHQQWQIVGQVLIVDDDGNVLALGKDAQGNDARTCTVVIPVERFKGNEFEAAYQQARTMCDDLLERLKREKPNGSDTLE